MQLHIHIDAGEAVLHEILASAKMREMWPSVWKNTWCQVEVYNPMQQGQWTAAWACPGEDMTRLWPWPVQFLWFGGIYGRRRQH